MQRRGHMGRAHHEASQSRPTETKKIKSLRDLIFWFVLFCFTWYDVIFRSSRRRYLTFVATASSNVRRDGVIKRSSRRRIFGFLDFRIFGLWDFWILEFWDFGIFLILGATGHGCSAEGTDAAPRAHGTGALQASEYERSSRRRYLTFVATALSNVHRDGVI